MVTLLQNYRNFGRNYIRRKERNYCRRKEIPSLFGFYKYFFYICTHIPLTMSQYLIYIKLPVYEKEWCEHHFGNPSVFPKASNVNAVIRHFTKERPSGALPEQQQSGELAIEIPDSQSKRASIFNYLTSAGKQGIASAIDDLFTIHLYESLTDVGARGVQVTTLIQDWIQSNGISLDQLDNLRQKFYRVKDSYRKSGVNVSRGYKRDTRNSKKC